MLFALRANEFNCVGFCYDAAGCAVSGAGALRLRARCSPLLLVEPPAPRAAPPPGPRELPPGAVLLPAGRLARALPAALAREPEWPVLAHVLRALPPLLHARALALGRRAQDLDLLAATLCSMVSDRSLSGAGGGRPLVSDFHAAALPSLAALASYHAYLEPQTQQRIVKCLLKYGMGKCSFRTPLGEVVSSLTPSCVPSAPSAAALHQRSHHVHPGDPGHDGQTAPGGAAGPVQDLRHQGHR